MKLTGTKTFMYWVEALVGVCDVTLDSFDGELSTETSSPTYFDSISNLIAAARLTHNAHINGNASLGELMNN